MQNNNKDKLPFTKYDFLGNTCGWIMWWRHTSGWVKESADFAEMIRIGGGVSVCGICACLYDGGSGYFIHLSTRGVMPVPCNCIR